MKKLLARTPTVFLLLLFFLLPHATRAQQPATSDAAETELALRQLGVVGSVLYVGAHPDDENTALLAYLAKGRGVRTAYLSLTRGDGGQNLLGSEKGEQLGLIRTQELLAARRIDGAEQFFTRAIDFGFSKSPEEALRIWGHDEVLSDVVWVIRRFRPDVIITRFPTTGEGGHGHHTASAILAGEAFDAAGDPTRFPEQLKYVEVWKPKRLLWNAFTFRPGEKPKDADKLLSVDVGDYNALLGKSYTEIAAESRTMHKSQGQGTPSRRGSALNYFALIKGEPATKDIFDGVDLTWHRIRNGDAVGQVLADAAQKYDAANPQGVLPLLVRAYTLLTSMETSKIPADPWVYEKRDKVGEVIRACAGLWIEATAPAPYVTLGSNIKITLTLVNRSDFPLRFTGLWQQFGLASNGLPPMEPAELKNNEPVTREVPQLVYGNSQPYWLREEPGKGLYTVKDQTLIGTPEDSPPMDVYVSIAANNGGDNIGFTVPVLYRWTDRVRGDLYRPVAVVPEVAVNVEERTLVFPDRAAKRVRVTLKSNVAAATDGTLRLKLPSGWSATPAQVPVTLKGGGEEFKAEFSVTPPQGAGVAELAAEFVSGGKVFTRGMEEIDYPHIPRQTLFPVADAKLVRVDLRRRGSRVGYVMGSGDEIPDALRQVGYDVTLLSDEDLAGADLSRFDAVITGVRAYNTRAALRQNQRRLLEYVERGGTLVVQYNTPDRTLEGAQLGPYPFRPVTDERVTDEDAAMTVLAPEDPILNAPNKIVPADFDGWVQERGLYFAHEWDAHYTPLFSAHDPGERDLKGSTLVARYGKGTYVFTALAFFRQLPAGVPGAYRLFVNMISAGKQ
jgi:LmbE family N-acetylglucosaminyl deacetylase